MTLNDLFAGKQPHDEDAVFCALENMELTSHAEIKKRVGHEVFTLYVACTTLSVWKNEGWGSVFAENHAIVPYIAEAMHAVGFPEIAKGVEQAHAAFPPWTDFADEDLCMDIAHFLENPRHKIGNTRLAQFSREERKKMCDAYGQALDHLDASAFPLWGPDAPGNEGWDALIGYVRRHWRQYRGNHAEIGKKCNHSEV